MLFRVLGLFLFVLNAFRPGSPPRSSRASKHSWLIRTGPSRMVRS